MKLEIERKFLLKSLPGIKHSESIDIDQYYFKNSSGIWERARTWQTKNGELKYIHTVKKNVSRGVNIEDEYEMSESDYKSFVEKCYKVDSESKFIKKTRYIYPDGELNWEIDLFHGNYRLIIGEIEIPKKTYKLVLPDFIKDVSLLEVTGLKQFNNRSLSLKIIKNAN